MTNDKFSIKEALGFGWTTFRSRIGFFIALVVVLGLVSFLPDFLTDRFMDNKSGGFLAVKLVLRLVGLILGMITTRISLNLLDPDGEALARLAELPSLFLKYLIGKVFYGIVSLIAALPGAIAFFAALAVESVLAKVFLGVIALAGLVLALYVSIMFMYVGYLVVDRGAGPIEALKDSRAITEGVVWPILVFALVIGLMNLVALIPVGLGLFVSVPVSLMASAFVYRKLSGAQADSAA